MLRPARQVAVIGCSRMGARLAEMLEALGLRLLILDPDPRSFKALSERFRGLCYTGELLNLEVLHRSGVTRADLVLAMSSRDELNMAVALILSRVLDSGPVLACVQDPFRAELYESFGLRLLCPTKLVLEKVLSSLEGGQS